MTTMLANQMSATVSAALPGIGNEVNEAGPGHWTFRLAKWRGAARLDDDWLELQLTRTKKRQIRSIKKSPASRREVQNSAWKLLEQTGSLGGPAKVALDVAGNVQVRTELPVDEGVDGERLVTVGRQLRDAVCRLDGRTRGLRSAQANPPLASVSSGEPASMGDLAKIVADAGWPTVERGGGRVAVELDVTGRYQQAIVEGQADATRVWVDLDVAQQVSPVSRQALALLLLTANRLVRLARAAAREREGEARVLFEVMLASCPTVDALTHALAALSMACRLCAREVELLQEEAIARQYLKVRGWSS